MLATNFKVFLHGAGQNEHRWVTSALEYLSRSLPGLDILQINPGQEISAATSAFRPATTS